MAANRQDIQIIRGVSKTFRLTVTDESSERVDLTSSTVHFRVKQNIEDAGTEIAKSSVTPAEVTLLAQSGATLGQADIFLQPSDTSGLPVGKHVYDVWVELSTGKRHAVVAPADFRIERAVTEL